MSLGLLPKSAIQWISSHLQLSTARAENLTEYGLETLKVAELKKLVKELERLIFTKEQQLNNASLRSDVRFYKPKCSAKKAEWIFCLRQCFYEDTTFTVVAPESDPIWKVIAVDGFIDEGSILSGNSGDDVRNGIETNGNGPNSCSMTSSSSIAPFPPRNVSWSNSCSMTSAPSIVQTPRQNEPWSSSTSTPSAVFAGVGGVAARAALPACGVLPSFPGQPLAPYGTAIASFHGAPRTPALHQNHINNVRVGPVPDGSNRKRPRNEMSEKKCTAKDDESQQIQATAELANGQLKSSTDSRTNSTEYPSSLAKAMAESLSKVKIKKERVNDDIRESSSFTSGTVSNNSTDNSDSNRSCDSSRDFDVRPRDPREWSMASQLRGMGFMDMREILNGLRHVEAERGGALATMDTSEQVEAAMMWIVTQREETEEARKLDEARIISEATLLEEERRKRESEQHVQDGTLDDIIGKEISETEESGGSVSSALFPASVVLQSMKVRRMFRTICMPKVGRENPEGKQEVIRYLNLEKKARKWYGTVVPWAYFRHVASPRIESWKSDRSVTGNSKRQKVRGSSGRDLIAKLRNERVNLEKALYTLSEQEEGGVGNVPRIFLSAREDAIRKGLPLCPENGLADGDIDDEVVIVEDNLDRITRESGISNEGAKTDRSSSTHSRNAKQERIKSPLKPNSVKDMDVVEIF